LFGRGITPCCYPPLLLDEPELPKPELPEEPELPEP
jgi:hypothetical protein